MTEWLEPAFTGIVVGTGVFLVLLTPAIIMQRRAYGRVHLTRIVVIAALCIYACALLAFTVVPTADMAELCLTRTGGKLRYIPLHSIREILQETEGAGTIQALTSWGAWQLALNIALFVPLGIFLRSYFHRSILLATAIGTGVSIMFEATQYTGFWGLYTCGIRVADIDDVLCNMLGTLFGALIGPLVLGSWLPRAHVLKERMRERIGLEHEQPPEDAAAAQPAPEPSSASDPVPDDPAPASPAAGRHAGSPRAEDPAAAPVPDAPGHGRRASR